MNKHIYDVVLVTCVEENLDKMADNKTFVALSDLDSMKF